MWRGGVLTHPKKLTFFPTQYTDSVLAPTIPLAFSIYRPWQLNRGAGLAAACASATRIADLLPPRWLAMGLRLLCLFWTFDTAALLVWLPWTYGWQTQRG